MQTSLHEGSPPQGDWGSEVIRFPKYRDREVKHLPNGKLVIFDEAFYTSTAADRRELLLTRDPIACGPPGILTDAMIKLFGHISFAREDVGLALKYLLLRNIPRLDHLIENCRTSGDIGCFVGVEGIHRTWMHRHSTIRSIENLALGAALVDGIEIEAPYMTMSCNAVRLTEKLPEATWVFRLHFQGQYFARIGVNFHYEGDDIVGSIANIQGQSKKVIRQTKAYFDWWSVLAVSNLAEQLPPEITVLRGLPALFHPSTPRVGFARMQERYDSTFEHARFKPIGDPVTFYELRRSRKVLDAAARRTMPKTDVPPE